MNERPAAPALALLVTTFSAAIAGCVIPIPARQSAPAIAGRKVEASDLQTVIPLKTSRDELIEKLGAPSLDLVGLRIVVYTWTTLRTTWLLLGMGGGGAIETTRRTVLFVALDEDNRVIKAGFDHRRGSDPVSMVLWARRWAGDNGLQLPQGNTGYAPAAIPTGQGLINVYRAAPAPSSLNFFSRARFPDPLGVAIDGRYVGELLDGDYLSLTVSPGAHEITVHPAPPYRPARSPDGSTNPSIHPSSTSVELREGEQCFVEAVATLTTGLSYDTRIQLLPEREATPAMSGAHSIW